MKYLLGLDLETTGLEVNHHEIMQIGIVLIDRHLNQIGTFSSLVKINHPERGITDDFDVYTYTHIDPQTLKNAPSLGTVLKKLMSFIKNKTKLQKNYHKIAIYGQNPKFDYEFLKNAFESCDMRFPFDYHVIGLDSIYTFYYFMNHGYLPEKVGQKYICDALEMINTREHDAINDIHAAFALLKVMVNRMQSTIQKEI